MVGVPRTCGGDPEHVDAIDAYLTKQEDVVGDGFSGDLYTRIAYMDKRIREISANNSALTEAVKTLVAAQGADPEKITQMVAGAVKAKLDSLQITMSTKTGQWGYYGGIRLLGLPNETLIFVRDLDKKVIKTSKNVTKAPKIVINCIKYAPGENRGQCQAYLHKKKVHI